MRYRAHLSSEGMDGGGEVGSGEGGTAVLDVGEDLEMSDRRIAREEMDAWETRSSAVGSGGGGTAAWQVGRGQIQYVGSTVR